MNFLVLLKKMWPAIVDVVLHGVNITQYFKKNKTIFILSIGVIFLFISFLYMYEQAIMHGTISRSLEFKILHITQEKNNSK